MIWLRALKLDCSDDPPTNNGLSRCQPCHLIPSSEFTTNTGDSYRRPIREMVRESESVEVVGEPLSRRLACSYSSTCFSTPNDISSPLPSGFLREVRSVLPIEATEEE